MRAIQSVIQQTEKCWELLLVDDGSTDGTQELLEPFFEEPRIKVIRLKDNRGVSFARNRAIEQSQGSWLSFIDSDDEWLPEKLEKQFDALRAHEEASWVHGEEIWIRNGVRVNPMKKHQKMGGDIYFSCLKLCCVSPSTVMIKKEVLKEVGLFREDFPVCEDYDLWLKIATKYPILFIQDFLIKKYGGHEDQLSRRYRAMDYWRVIAMEDRLKSGRLNQEQRRQTVEEIHKKASVLLKGYRKHGNLEKFDFIFQILKDCSATCE